MLIIRHLDVFRSQMDSEILPLSDDALAAPESSSQIRKGSHRDLERDSALRPSPEPGDSSAS